MLADPPEASDRSSVGLAVVALGIVASILPVFLLGSLSIEIRADLGYGEATAGLVLAAFFASSAAVSSRIGIAVDRIGPRRGLTIALSTSLVIQLLVAATARGPLVLGCCSAAAGVANATAQLSANVYIARNLPVRRQGVGFAVKQSAMPGASLVAGLTLPLIALRYGWRWVFVLGAALTALAVLAVATWIRPKPVPAPAATEPGRGGPMPPRIALGALAVAAAFSTAAAITLGGFFVESAIDAGIAAGTAGLAFSAGSLVSVVVRLSVGAWADRRGGALLGVVAAMLAVGALTSLWFSWREPWVQLIGVPLAFGAGWAWPGLFNLSVVRAAPTAPGRATGITQTGTYLGGAVGPILFGAMAEAAGFRAAWWLAAALGAGAAVAVLIGRSVLERSA